MGSGVIPDDEEDQFLPGFHDGPAAIRQALDYLKDHDECRAGLDALEYVVDTIGLDLVAVIERWEKVPHVFIMGTEELLAYERGQRVFKAFTDTMKVRASP